MFDIHYIHMVDYVHEVPVKVQIQQPAMKILRADGEANKIVKSGVPVLLIVHGTLPTKKGVVVPKVTFMVSFRLSWPFESGLSFIRKTAGKTGGMSFTTSELHVISGNAFDGPITIEHRKHSTARAKDFGWG